MTKMSKFKFYFLSFTWGLPVTLLGLVMALVCVICGKKPKKWGYCWYFDVGEHWGGTELGIFFIKDSWTRFKYFRRHIADCSINQYSVIPSASSAVLMPPAPTPANIRNNARAKARI